MTITTSFEFSGYSDYWHGMGDRGEGHGAAFAYYGRDTTLRDLVDQWVQESWHNDCDFADLPESVTQDDIRASILESFTDKGRDDYKDNALCELAADLDDERECRSCFNSVDELHDVNCDYYEEDEDLIVMDEDCDDGDDYSESPVAIMEIDWSDHPDYTRKEN